MYPFDHPSVDLLVGAALAEDLGRGDVTTDTTVPPAVRGTAEIVAKQAGVLAAGPSVARVFDCLCGSEIAVELTLAEGASFAPGDVVGRLSGPAAQLLRGERVALNFLQRLCGVVTVTKSFVDVVAGTGVRLVDTRKTTPGMRVLEKYAVRMGGAHNHRGGLDDGVLIKDNHIVAAGGVAAAVAGARAAAPHTLKIEIECTDSAEIEAALAAGVDAILLDNMSLDEMRSAVRQIDHRAVVEASGGVRLDTVRAIAETGVDIISVGALTHSAGSIDLSMRLRLDEM